MCTFEMPKPVRRFEAFPYPLLMFLGTSSSEFGVYCELSGPGSITFVFGPGSTVEHGETFVEAVRQIGR